MKNACLQSLLALVLLSIAISCRSENTAVDPVAATVTATRPADAFSLKLPNPASKWHQHYKFQPIDKAWRVEESALEPGVNYFTMIKPGEHKAGKKYYRELRYFASSSPEPRKIMRFDPDGNIDCEIDRNIPVADSTKGTQHNRSFRADGSMSGYSYWKDGRFVEKLKVDKNGGVEKLENGRGLLHGTLTGGIGVRSWYFQGLEFLEEWSEDGKLTRVQLNLLASSNDILMVYQPDQIREQLSFHGECWERSGLNGGRQWSKDGNGFRAPDDGAIEAGHYGRPPPPPDEQALAREAKRYTERRGEFLKAFATQVAKAGYTLDELGLKPLVPDLSAPATQPATAPATGPATLPADDPRRGAVVTVEPDKKEYFLGESVLLQWRIRNAGDEPFEISVGGDWRFLVEAVDQTGRRVDPNPSDCRSVDGWVVKTTLQPGEEFSRYDTFLGTGETLHLMRYLQFSQPGTYTVSVYHDLGWEVNSSVASFARTGWGDSKGPHLAPVATTTIRLDMPTAEQARKVVESYHDYEFLSYPVYLPIVKELAQKGDTNALNAIGVIATPEATAALVELLGHKDPAIAAKAWDVLAQRAISLDWLADKRLAESAWTDELKRAALVPAWKLLDANDRDKIIQGARVVHALGSKDDLPALIKVMDRVLPLFKDDAVEQAVFLRPATASGALDDATCTLIQRGAKPPGAAGTPGQAVAFMIGLGHNADFRPDGWRKVAVGLIDHPIPYLRDVALRNMPLPLDDAATAAVAHAMKDKFAPVQAAACDLATKAKAPALGSPAIDVLKFTDNEWVLRAAFYAAGACGIGNDTRLEICVGMMKPLTSHRNYLVLDLLIGGSLE